MRDSTPRTAGDGLRLAHYWWPVVMSWSIAEVAARATGQPWSSAGTSMLLCGALAAYSLDRLIDPESAPRSRWLQVLLVVGLATATTVGLALLPLLAPAKVALLLVCALVAMAYPRVKRWPVAKALVVPAVWTWAGLALPTADGGRAVWHLSSLPVAAPLFALLAAGCLLCDVKDSHSDARSGVRSLPAMLGVPVTLATAGSLALCAGALALAQHRPGLLVAALGLAILTPCRALLATATVGPLLVDMILTVPGALIAVRLV